MGMQVTHRRAPLRSQNELKAERQDFKVIQFLGTEANSSEDHFEKPAAKKTEGFFKKDIFKKGLLASLMGMMALTSVGCTTDVGKMEKALAEIPTTQTENRIEFLKKQLRHENPKVVTKAIEHLGNSTISLKEKTELVLEFLQNSNDTKVTAAKHLGSKLVALSETPLNLRQSLQRAMDSRPWTEAYTVSHTEYTYHYGYNMFSGKYEFHFGPETQYETKYRDHGNAMAYASAYKEVKDILETLK